MHERTAFRLAMLANGFQPLLNDCKRSIETGWPKRIVDEAQVLSWDRSALASTGLKLDGDLAVIDVDVSEAGLVEALAGALDERFPALFAHGLVRHAGGPKEAWIARVDEPFRRLASRRWYRGGDPDDPAVPKHMVECFGSLGTRQFAIDGPHARDRRGEVSSVYQFAGGASPATTRRESLPVLPKAAYALGLRSVRRDCRRGGAHRREGIWRKPRSYASVFRARRGHRDRDARPWRDDGRRARTPHASAKGARRRADVDSALLRQLPRPNAGADRFSPDQLGPLRSRHLRHDDGNDLASARESPVCGAVRVPGATT
jgi:hypothetical protein